MLGCWCSTRCALCVWCLFVVCRMCPCVLHNYNVRVLVIHYRLVQDAMAWLAIHCTESCIESSAVPDKSLAQCRGVMPVCLVNTRTKTAGSPSHQGTGKQHTCPVIADFGMSMSAFCGWYTPSSRRGLDPSRFNGPPPPEPCHQGLGTAYMAALMNWPECHY
jgi:hypothetical protein